MRTGLKILGTAKINMCTSLAPYSSCLASEHITPILYKVLDGIRYIITNPIITVTVLTLKDGSPAVVFVDVEFVLTGEPGFGESRST